MPLREGDRTTGVAVRLCEFCELTTVIPPLGNSANLLRWQKLELAKRQLHSQLRALGLPPYAFDPDIESVPPLTYEFVQKGAARGSPVMMGHCEGKITIVAEEADGAYREQQRESLGEPQRTLVGHFRHEIGHYIDLVGVSSARRGEYHELFGDPQSIDYERAKADHYGLAADTLAWQGQFVSRYAAMHPWEDFAETVDAFLKLAAVMQVAFDHRIVDVASAGSLVDDDLLRTYRQIALLSNELNFSRGLDMLIPEIISDQVRRKLVFVASLCRSGGPAAGSDAGRNGDLMFDDTVAADVQLQDPQADEVLQPER